MTTDVEFSAICATCGEVDLGSDQIWLVLTSHPARNRYAFRCPRCSAVAQRPADHDTVALLARIVAVEQVDIPAEALESHVGATLTVDDLIDLMLSITEYETTGPESLDSCH